MTERRRTKRQRSSLLERSTLLLQRKSWGRTLPVSEHEVRDLSFFLYAGGRARLFCFKVGGAPPFLLERMLSSNRISFPHGGALSPFTLARSEIASIFLRLKGDIPRGKGALRFKEILFYSQEQLGVSSLFVSEDEVKSFSFPLQGRGEDRLLLSRLQVWKSSILSS